MSYKQVIARLKKRKNMARVKLVMERAERVGAIEIYPMEMDRWNFGKMENGVWVDSQEPKPDGTYDKMGLSGSDVQGYWDFYWWQPKNWKAFANEIWKYLKGVEEFFFDTLFSKFYLKNPKLLFNQFYIWVIKLHPLRVKRTGWVWVCDSKKATVENESWELADDLIAQELGYKDGTDYFLKKKDTLYSTKKEELKALAKKLLEEEPDRVWNYFLNKNGYTRVADYMWVNKKDPTCFVIDESVAPFDLRDGWSAQGLVRPIAAWIRVMYDKDITVVHKEDRE